MEAAMLRQFICSLFLLCFSISPAKAVFIEPFFGYATGDLDLTASAMLSSTTLSDSFDIKGANYGVRAGFEPGNFQLGAEYLFNNFTASGGSIPLEDDKLRVQEISLFLGYRFWHMRVYGALTSADDSDSDLSGEGFKAGLSFYPLKNIALNLEYKTIEMTGLVDTVFMDANYDTLALLVSFPFSF
jgi:hypothetical protein